jgi:transposase
MTVNKFIRKLLGLKELKVTGFCMAPEKRGDLDLFVKPYKNGCRCPECERRCPVVRQMEDLRMWRDPPIYGRTVNLWYRPREVQCPTHGRVQEMIPWADRFARVTYRFDFLLLIFCQMMTQKSAARVLRLAASTLSDLLHRSITRLRKGHKIGELTSIGIDEISYCKGHKYATVVYDIERSSVVWVGKGKGREAIDAFFNEVLSPEQKQGIRWATCDMSQAYIGAIEHHCPNATLVLDRFHIAKALNNAVDEVRKEEWRKASGAERKALKGLRWLLYKHSSNRSKEERATLEALRNGNRRIHRAWILKDEFEQFWEYNAPWAAQRFLKRWMTTALRSRIPSIRTFVGTLKEHAHRILPYINSRLTNSIGEGLNRIIKIVKNRASGFRNLEAFSDMIYLTVGDLDLPAQIHADFHAL